MRSRRLLLGALLGLSSACFAEAPTVGDPVGGDAGDDADVDDGPVQVAEEGGDDGDENDDDDDDDDDDDTTAGGDDDDDAAPGCGNGMVDPGEECDDGAANASHAACTPDCLFARCGDGWLRDGEECDDGNLQRGDGCDDACRIEGVGCAAAAETIGLGPLENIAVCRDPSGTTCEEDFATLCAPGWELCTPLQHHTRNEGWLLPIHPRKALGAIRCRAAGGAGHYAITDVSVDPAANCETGSSRPECPASLGCTETQEYALCCAPTPTCGDGVLDPPEEECDDGNALEMDGCTMACTTTYADAPHC